jgi:pullulanase
MRIFIDSMTLLRIESDAYITDIKIPDYTIKWVKNEGYNQYFVANRPLELHLVDEIEINHQTYPVEIGLVTLTKEFENRFRYDGKLGYDYGKTSTKFTVFSPVAKEINVVIDEIVYPMTYHEPVWERVVDGDMLNKKYHYQVRLVNEFKDVLDPYADAMAYDGSYIIDWDRLDPIMPTPIVLKHMTDAVIYEGHVRDLTVHLDIKHPGLFEGLIEDSKLLKGSVLNYIKKLGMTHLQLLPVFDFEGVHDINKKLAYNWGYNPSCYFAIEGWFSEDPYDPYDRINAFRSVINEAHQMKLGINMDVVYNHVFNHKTFGYDDLVPGYFYRHNGLKKMTDASFCGNDVETRNYMVRRLIVDSLIHFQEKFQIDGFRFDLMGLLDLDTMLLIEQELKKRHPSIMLYGEGWNMLTEVPHKLRSNMNNQALFQGYSHFNDFFRNVMKGDLHSEQLGYAMGNKNLSTKAMDAIIGSPVMFQSPNQSINYVECHDNLTYYDKMLLSCGFAKDAFKECQDFANHVIAISQGVPFYHAGQEFYRSKMGVENSYNSPDEINQIVWNPKTDGVSKLKKLLKIRKKYALYRMPSYGDHVTITKQGQTLIYTLSNNKIKLIHYLKCDRGIEKFSRENGELIFSSQHILNEETDIYVDKPGVYIIQTNV